jgi:hypothetical protein
VIVCDHVCGGRVVMCVVGAWWCVWWARGDVCGGRVVMCVVGAYINISLVILVLV